MAKPKNGERRRQANLDDQIPDPNEVDFASPGFGQDDDPGPSVKQGSKLRALAFDVFLFGFVLLGAISMVLLLLRPFDFYSKIPLNEGITGAVLLVTAITGVAVIVTILATVVISIFRSWFRHR